MTKHLVKMITNLKYFLSQLKISCCLNNNNCVKLLVSVNNYYRVEYFNFF